MPLGCSQQLLSKIPSQIFLYYQEVQVLNSFVSSIHSALVIRLEVEIMMICQGKIIVICNQQYQVYEFMFKLFYIYKYQRQQNYLHVENQSRSIIQICKMRGKQNIISYISENDFINFFVVSKSMNYLKNVLDSIYKSLAPANIPTKIEINILVRFEVTQISSFSERHLISRKFTAEVYKASAETHQSLPMCPEFILQ